MHDVLLGTVYRGWVAESRHFGRVAVVSNNGEVRLALGDMEVPTLPRSALKPFQVMAMLAAGLDLDGKLLALAGASHLGEPIHTDGALEILEGVGLSASDLRNTADLPGDSEARTDWLRQGRGSEPLAHNCSGKHAAMLRTCVRAGWPIETYRDPEHPLQHAVRRVIDAYCGVIDEPVADGCTAPAFVTTLPGLARGFGRVAANDQGPARQLADAYREFPEYISGTKDPTVALIRSVPGLIAKFGAEGVLALGLADGTGIAIKISDGSGRGRFDVACAVLERLGYLPHGIKPEFHLDEGLIEALAPLQQR